MPVIEIVAALRARARIGGHLVLRVAGRRERCWPQFASMPAQTSSSGSARRLRREHGARLERELIVRDVGRPSASAALDICSASAHVCCGSAYIRSRLKLPSPGRVQLRGRACASRPRVDAPERAQLRAAIEALRAQGNPRDAGSAILPRTRPRSMVPGLASSVISASAASCRCAAQRCRAAARSPRGENRLGVPPPKNTLCTAAAAHRGACASRSRSSALDVGAPRRIRRAACRN